jgi:pimeloyl-ACP methyl ester carboxylesterase
VDDDMADLRLRTQKADGISFGLLECGPDDGPLAICLHGFPDTAWTWRHLLPLLADAGYHAVAPFLRGYAPTELAPDGAYQTGALVSDACALADALDHDSSESVVIGHDWGAMAAYGAGVLRPERFKKVVAMAVPPLPAVAETFLAYDNIKRIFYAFFFQSPLADFAVAADDYAFIDRLWADWSPGYDASWDLARVKESIGEPQRVTAAITYYRHTFGSDGQLPEYEEAQQASSAVPPQPTLYFHGTDDGCMSVELASGVESILAPGSEVVVVDRAGHFLQLEQPDLVNDAVIRFLDS